MHKKTLLEFGKSPHSKCHSSGNLILKQTYKTVYTIVLLVLQITIRDTNLVFTAPFGQSFLSLNGLEGHTDYTANVSTACNWIKRQKCLSASLALKPFLSMCQLLIKNIHKKIKKITFGIGQALNAINREHS